MTNYKITHEVANKRFTMQVDGRTCLLEYNHPKKDVYDLYHTEVPLELRGRGLAKHLVTNSLDIIIQLNCKFIPSCSYVLKVVQEEEEEGGGKYSNHIY